MSKKVKISFPELAVQVARAINFDGNMFAMQWPHKFRAVALVDGARLIVEERDGQVIREVAPKFLAQKIVDWLQLGQLPEFYLTLSKALEAVEIWLSITTPVALSEIKFVRPASEWGYTWHRLPWDLTAARTPTWDLLFKRCSNVRAFKAWIGSLFFDESDLQQYIWCFGSGNNGKGSINRFLFRIFGRAYASKQTPGREHKHWTHGLVGKRLVVFPDCNDATFVTEGLFKSLTGGDPVDVNPKFRDLFTMVMGAKYIFLSNERPNLSSEAADTRRIIYCEFESRDGEANDPDFERLLWDEGAGFLADCIAIYTEMAPKHTPLVSEKAEILDWVDTIEGEFAEALDFHFQVLPKDTPDIEWIRPVVLQRHLDMSFKTRYQKIQFLAWLERRHMIKKVTDHSLPSHPKVYRGLVSRPACYLLQLDNGKFTRDTGPARDGNRDVKPDGAKP